MKTLREFSCPKADDELTMTELNVIEKALDRVFAAINVDITFSRHFKERVNDHRNKRQISRCELLTIFKEFFEKYGNSIKGNPKQIERLIKSITSDINIPIVIKWNKGKHEIEIVTKTIMRKKGFKTSTQIMKVENNAEI